MVLLVDSGCAIVSVGFRRRVLRQGMMTVLFYDDTFWIEHSSNTFRCRYVALADEYINPMLRNNIYNLFMAMDSEMVQGDEMEKKSISRSRRLIIKFLKLVAQHFRTTREVSFYAQQLCITTTYLYKLTHRRWNLSPKELID